MEKKILKIEGMSCEHCVRAVERAVNGVTGLADAVADLKGGTVSFGFDPASTPFENIISAIEAESYSVVR